MNQKIDNNGIGALYATFYIDPSVEDRIKVGDAVTMAGNNTIEYSTRDSPIIGRVEHLQINEKIATVQVSGVARFRTVMTLPDQIQLPGMAIDGDGEGNVILVTPRKGGRGIVLSVDKVAHTVDVLL